MKIAFLDANVLFSIGYREKTRLATLNNIKNLRLITSHYALEEAYRNLADALQRQRLENWLKKVEIVIEAPITLLPSNIVLAAKDQPILTAALQAKADYLITGDYKDFGQFFGKPLAGIVILPPALFFEVTDHP